jgi:hypothetical protein
MRSAIGQVERFPRRWYACANCILRIDLSNMDAQLREAQPDVPSTMWAPSRRGP